MSDSSSNGTDEMHSDTEQKGSNDSGGGTGWPGWTEEQNEFITTWWKYALDLVTYFNGGWSNGPSNDQPPKKPEGNIMYLLKNGKYQVKKLDLDSIKAMTAEAFHQYLMSMRAVFDDSIITVGVNQTPKNMKEIAELLKQEHTILNREEAGTFARHLNMGKLLLVAKRKFDCEKRKKKLKQTWVMWIEENTLIKQAYDRQHREIATLVEKYTKLAKLQISYADFIKIKNKIKDVFYENTHIGEQWK